MQPNIFELDVKQYGAYGDGIHDDLPAFNAAISALGGVGKNSAGATLYVSKGKYRLSGQLQIRRGMILRGASGAGWYSGTQLIFDDGTHGLVVTRHNTSIDDGRGDWSTIENVGIIAADKTVPDKHGIWLHARCRISNCYISGFSGHGICIHADAVSFPKEAPLWAAGTAYKIGDNVLNDNGKWYFCTQAGTSASLGGPAGMGSALADGGCKWNYVQGTNANNWAVEYCRIEANGKSGIFCKGGDSNAGYALGVDSSDNSEWGINDESFLGNTYIACHVAGNKRGAYNSATLAGVTTFIGCYSEGDQPHSQFSKSTVNIGGLHGAGIQGSFSDLRSNRHNASEFRTRTGGEGTAENPFTYEHLIGVGDESGSGAVMRLSGSLNNFYWKRLLNQAGHPQSVVWNFANLGVSYAWGMALEEAIHRAGAGLGRQLKPGQLFTGENYGLLLQGAMLNAVEDISRMEGSSLVGDIVFNKAAIPGGNAGWICTGRGTNGIFTEDITATADSTTSIALSPGTHYLWGLKVGERVMINGIDTYVTAKPTGHSANTVTLADPIPAGTGLSIDYVNPTWVAFGEISGGIPDATLMPGETIQHTMKGRLAIAAGSDSVVVSNNKVSPDSCVFVTIQTCDDTLTHITCVVPDTGSFTIFGNAPASDNVYVCWKLEV